MLRTPALQKAIQRDGRPRRQSLVGRMDASTTAYGRIMITPEIAGTSRDVLCPSRSSEAQARVLLDLIGSMTGCEFSRVRSSASSRSRRFRRAAASRYAAK